MAFRPLYRFLTLILAGMALTGGLAACGPVLAIPPGAATSAPEQADNTSDYLFKTGDTVKLAVYGEEGLTKGYMIDSRGLINVPLIGDVKAAGFSRAHVQKDITTRLTEGGFLANPLVTVDTTAVQPFYIIGEVKTPGSYPWQPSLDGLKAIATAGGYTPRAAQNKILIDRIVGEGKDEKKVRLNATENTAILPGDSIIVRERIF